MKNNTLIFSLLFLLVLPIIANAQIQTIHATWSYQDTSSIAGFRIYHENNPVCVVDDPTATSASCDVDTTDGETWFTITAFNENGNESLHTDPVPYIFTSDLKAAFSSDKLTGNSPLQVTFDASASTGNIASYNWEMGDGGTATGSQVTYTYTSAGPYHPTLTVTDNGGLTDSISIPIQVQHTGLLEISRAVWREDISRLVVKGNGTAGHIVNVYDIDFKNLLGSVSVKSDGKWIFRLKNPSPIPQKVKAKSRGQRAVKRVSRLPVIE